MGVELELYVLVILLTIGSSVFAPFEVETPAVRKALKWFIVVGATVGLSMRWDTWRFCFRLPLARQDRSSTSRGAGNTGSIRSMRPPAVGTMNCGSGSGGTDVWRAPS